MSTIRHLIYGLTGEQPALITLFRLMPAWQQALVFMVPHAIVSAILSLLLTNSFPKRFSQNRFGLLALFFCFAFFLPLFGALAILTLKLYFIKFKYLDERDEFSSVPPPPFLQEAAAVAPGMGEGGAWSRLRTTSLPRSERIQALMAVGGGGSGFNANRFLQLATGDSDDEIRLLAFNLCERHEQKINQAITTALEGLKAASDPANQAAFCRDLAFSYWELVYNSLSQNELRAFFIEQSLKYLRKADELGGNTPSLSILLGKIYLTKREQDKAGEAIHSALNNGVSPSLAIPYLAELAFLKRDFVAVKEFLAQDPTLRLKPGIGPVAQFWRE